MMNTIQKTVSVDFRGRIFIAVLLTMIVSPVFSSSITVFSPNGSEQIPSGSAFTIEWDSIDLVSDVRIEYSIDNGANWTLVIDQDLPNTGSFLWDPVPETYTSNALVKIYAVTDLLVADTSDNPFYIYACLSKIQADLNNDCYVDLEDSTLLASMWMLCANPLDPFCDTECPEGYGECDGLLFNGCEVSLLTDINNCGLCGHICAFANAEALCVDGNCVMGNCLPGYSDLNGDPNDGCESECTWISETDLPDDDFIDANCDGIDGEVEKAVFVDSLAGNNSNPGISPEFPLLTIQAGINAAVAYGRDYVLISQGTYWESLSLASGVSLYGSYNASAGWERSSSYTTTVAGGVEGLYSDSVSNMTIAHLTISSADASGSGQSSYSVFLTSVSDISIHSCTLKAGKGTGGTTGSNGALGSNGDAGQAGQPGCENDTGVSCSTCALPLRGNGGSSPSGYAGGRGGTPGLGTLFGLDGSTPTGGGSGGAGGLSTMDGEPGQSGNNGANGINGSGGSFFGTVSASGYIVSSGTAGTAGQAGRGGGGGGGGGGGPDGIDYCDSYGGAGGGGGGGAAGGDKGIGGQGGGGSFGIWLYQCSSIDITACTIQTGNGGNGGNGGTGGQGGLGGIGGSGGTGEDDSGNGGAGGDGGNGGDGGHGGGGGGGPSIGILADSASLWSQSGNIFVLGSGGAGGTSPGSPGSVGLATNEYTTE